MENAITVTEGFWARCWRKASDSVYGTAQVVTVTAQAVVAKTKAVAISSWTWLKIQLAKLAAWTVVAKAIVVREARGIGRAAKSLPSTVAAKATRLWNLVTTGRIFGAVKAVLAKAAEEVVTGVFELVQFAGLLVKVWWARLLQLAHVVTKYKNLVYVGLAAYAMSLVGVPFVGLLASFVGLFTLISADLLVQINSARAEYQYYYDSDGSYKYEFSAV